MVSLPEGERLKDARYKQNNNIISNSTLLNILPPQLKNMGTCYKVMCGCGCWVFSKIIHTSLLTWSDFHLKNLNTKVTTHKTDDLVKYQVIFLKPIITIQVHSFFHVNNTASDMSNTTKCNFPSKYNVVPHCKCMLSCCVKWPHISIPSQEANRETTSTCPIIGFRVYRNVSCCTLNVIHPYKEQNNVNFFLQFLEQINPKIIHTKGDCVTRDIYHRIS